MDQLTLTATQALAASGRIELANEPSFRLGELTVRPSRCEVEGLGVAQTLQRRVMQVLVALARSPSEVVSHDELIRRCWGGLTVGEDAIRRCIAQLRRLAEAWPQPPFEIETIPGVGYRLSPKADRAQGLAEAPNAAAPRRPSRSTLWWMVGAGLALLVVAAAIWAALAGFGHRAPETAGPLVEVRAFSTIGGDPTLPPLAAQASDAIAGFLGDAGVRLTSGANARAPANGQLALGGALSRTASELRLHLILTDARTGASVWVHDFTETPERADALIDAAKGRALETMHLVREANGRSGPPLDAETLQLAVRGGEILNVASVGSLEDGVRPYEEALKRRPDAAPLRARYAYALSQLALGSSGTQRDALTQQTRAEADRVIRDHPDQAGLARLALLAIAQAQAPHDLIATEKGLDAALQAAPDEPFLYGAKCDFLVGVGRGAEAGRFCDRALSLRPFTGQFLLSRGQALDIQGELPHIADQDLALAARLYPDFLELRVYRFARQAFDGSPDKALSLLHDPDTTPPPLSPGAVAEMDALEKARKSGAAADAERALALLRRNDAHLAISDSRFLFPMALGRLSEAFADVRDLSIVEGDEGELLTFAFTASLRRDPRFWPLAAKAGLTHYWLTTNRWPDFCKDPTYPLDCHAQARRADSQLGGRATSGAASRM